MIRLLLSLVDPIGAVVKQIVAAKAANQDETVKALEAKRDVLIAESRSSRVNALIRASFALPFVIYNAKLVLWDKVLGLGATDPLSPELFQIELAAIGFYFLYDIAARLRR